MPSCYYYDEQHNRCNCYVNENLNWLLAENAKLRELLADVWNDSVTRMDPVERRAIIGKFIDRMRELELEV